MSEKLVPLISQYVSAERMHEVDAWIAKYPADAKKSAVMRVLMIVQEEQGYLTTESMDAVAEYLDMPCIAVYEVATFYTMYEHSPTGRHVINVCTNISCLLRGSSEIVKKLEKKLKVKVGETTEDGRFSLRAVECLGACVNAPMMQINKNYHENLTPDSLDSVLEEYS
jgi:NADH-quinone oxidoreductase subunit E